MHTETTTDPFSIEQLNNIVLFSFFLDQEQFHQSVRPWKDNKMKLQSPVTAKKLFFFFSYVTSTPISQISNLLQDFWQNTDSPMPLLALFWNISIKTQIKTKPYHQINLYCHLTEVKINSTLKNIGEHQSQNVPT